MFHLPGSNMNGRSSTVYCPGRTRYIHEEASCVNDSVEVKYLGLIRLLPAGVELLELSPGESCRLGG